MSLNMKGQITFTNNLNNFRGNLNNSTDNTSVINVTKINKDLNYSGVVSNTIIAPSSDTSNFTVKEELTNQQSGKYCFYIRFIENDGKPYNYYEGDNSGLKGSGYDGFENNVKYDLYNIYTNIVKNISDSDKLEKQMSHLKKHIGKVQDKIDKDYINNIIKILKKKKSSYEKIINKKKSGEDDIRAAARYCAILNYDVGDVSFGDNQYTPQYSIQYQYTYNNDTYINSDKQVSFKLHCFETGKDENSDNFIQPISLWEKYLTENDNESSLINEFFNNYINMSVTETVSISEESDNTSYVLVTDAVNAENETSSTENIEVEEPKESDAVLVKNLYDTGTSLISRNIYKDDGTVIKNSEFTENNEKYKVTEYSFRNDTIEINPYIENGGYLLISNDKIELYEYNNNLNKEIKPNIQMINNINNNSQIILNHSLNDTNSSTTTTITDSHIELRSGTITSYLFPGRFSIIKGTNTIDITDSYMNLNNKSNYSIKFNMLTFGNTDIITFYSNSLIKCNMSINRHFESSNDDDILFSSDGYYNISNLMKSNIKKINEYILDKKINNNSDFYILTNIFSELNAFTFNISIGNSGAITIVYANKIYYNNSNTNTNAWRFKFYDSNKIIIITFLIKDDFTISSWKLGTINIDWE
jgi:hypothetical protein